MTGKHFNWRRRWTADLLNATAAHDTGLVVRFLALPLSEEQKRDHEADAAIGQCWTADGRQWGIVTTPDNQRAVFEALRARHGVNNAAQMVARLAREAGELWTWHKQQEH